jgi:hypothetical protein
MTVARKPGTALVRKSKTLEPATFKTSLRLWQARWKAQQAAQGGADKEPALNGATLSRQ